MGIGLTISKLSKESDVRHLLLLDVCVCVAGILESVIMMCLCCFFESDDEMKVNGEVGVESQKSMKGRCGIAFGPQHFPRIFVRFGAMARSGAVVGLLLAAAAFGSCFLGGVPTQPPRAPPTQNHVDSLGAAPVQSESSESYSWAAPLLSFGAALGVIFGLVAAQPAKAITAEQFSQLTYAQVRGSGLANRCPTVESNGSEVPVKAGSKMINVCFEPKSFAVEIDTDNGKEFATTKLTTRQTYTLAFIEGNLDPNPITFKEQDGMDFAATTVKLPDGEYVPFLFTVKELVAKGEGSSFKPGFTWGGEFSVPSYRTGGFLDPKARGMNLGYDQAVALPAMQADGKSGQEDIFKETNKVFDVGRGAIEMEVNKAGLIVRGCTG